jgi:hypothetical protein
MLKILEHILLGAAIAPRNKLRSLEIITLSKIYRHIQIRVDLVK